MFMKYILLVGVFLPLFAVAQSKFALIDKNLRQPIIYTDSVTVEQVTKGYFPIENKSIDSLIANIVYLRDLLSKMQRAKMESFELRSSNAIITTTRVPHAYGDRYNVIAQSNNGQVQAKLNLVNSKDSNKLLKCSSFVIILFCNYNYIVQLWRYFIWGLIK